MSNYFNPHPLFEFETDCKEKIVEDHDYMHIYQSIWHASTHEAIIASQLYPLQPAAKKIYVSVPQNHHDVLLTLNTVIWDPND